MTRKHLKIFIEVCNEFSMTEAAKKLFMTQPAVSRAIKEMEDYYDVRLFERLSKKLYLTEQGEEILNYARNIIYMFDEMEKSIKKWEYVQTLRIGSSITIGNHMLSEFIETLKIKYPKISVQVKIDNSLEIEKRILDDQIDIGLIEGTVHNSRINYEKFTKDRLVVVCSKKHPLFNKGEISIEKLSSEQLILREVGSGARAFFDSIMTVKEIEYEPIWESVSTQAILRAVSENLGIAVLPYMMVKEKIKRNEIGIINIKDANFERNYYVISHKNKYISNVMSSFIDIVKKIDK